ncbi:hypothetical protein CALCODRAFT_504218 [Calocera cornea HHB12733]|uniref:Uncharacterized protein n=1 Tax=Calocera cornea HHB12733 TaxID=1353952 RepID=A0A165CJ17_9BASI|nr:hypothetical protein CALCODRAFT_504218 [Calocera cornea HHB12733]
MRPRIRPRRPPSAGRRTVLSRQYATSSGSGSAASSSPYHRKVNALPFTLSPADAQRAFQQYLAHSSLLRAVDWWSALKYYWAVYDWGSVLQTHISDTDFKWEMSKMRPMYVPMWRVLAGVEVRYEQLGERYKPGTGPDRTLHELARLSGSMPGHAHHPLRSCWLSEEYHHADVRFMPFTRSMLTTPWGEQVGAIPYTVSPQKLLKLVNKLTVQGHIYPTLGLNVFPGAKVVQPRFSPMVMPVYLADFTLKYMSQRITLVLPAWVGHPSGKQPADSSFEKWVYGPRNEAEPYGPRSYYHSFMTDQNAAWLLTLIPLDPEGRPKPRGNLVDLLGLLRLTMAWSTVGGMDDGMWEDDMIKDWGRRHEWRDEFLRERKIWPDNAKS